MRKGGSIGARGHHDFRIGIDAFPSLIAENVYFCGFTSESSFGAWSYLIVRSEAEGGNLLVDSPRFATQLVRRIEALGGRMSVQSPKGEGTTVEVALPLDGEYQAADNFRVNVGESLLRSSG